MSKEKTFNWINKALNLGLKVKRELRASRNEKRAEKREERAETKFSERKVPTKMYFGRVVEDKTQNSGE